MGENSKSEGERQSDGKGMRGREEKREEVGKRGKEEEENSLETAEKATRKERKGP